MTHKLLFLGFISFSILACASKQSLVFKANDKQIVSEDGSQVTSSANFPITLKVNNPFPVNNSLYRFVLSIKNTSQERTTLSLKDIKIENTAAQILTDIQARDQITTWRDSETERARKREERLAFGTYAQYEADYTPGLIDGDIEYSPQAGLDVEILQSQTRKKIDQMEKLSESALSEIDAGYLNTLFLAPGDMESRVFYISLEEKNTGEEINISVKTPWGSVMFLAGIKN